MRVIFDIDGVLIDKKGDPIKRNIRLLEKCRYKGFDISFWTGKRESERNNVEDFFSARPIEIHKYELRMRPDDWVGVSGAELKKGWATQLFRDSDCIDDILFAIDDNPAVIEVYESFGIPVILYKSEFYKY